MSVDERFVRLPHFLHHVLPGLTRGSALTHLLATYNWVGDRPPGMPTEISFGDGLTQVVLNELTPRRVTAELPELLRSNVDPEIPLLATIYAGRGRFLQMIAVTRIVRMIRPNARLVVATCGCVTEDQEHFLRCGLDTDVISHVVLVECSGSKTMGLIRDAVANNRLGTPALGPVATAAPLSLGV